ncbi:MAG: alpha/beta hydrolase, partial [Methanoregula sp.]|nr:alpha/beta hydrolase [Methanoregula sp.]
MRTLTILILAAVLVTAAVFAGCSGTTTKSTYSVDDKGLLSVTCVPVTASVEVLASNETYTKSKITLHTQSGDVITYLAAPSTPKAAIVYVPGAGEKLAGHEKRMVTYAAAGYAFLFVDTRGNGGETAGVPFGQQMIQQDFSAFRSGEWPQYYLTICDLINARQYLSDRFSVPVYAMGSSNGGRYAAIAAGVDPSFAGYVGISTSDWGVLESVTANGNTGDPVRFATSLEPSTYLPEIAPRPVWMYHNATDPIIPFAGGKA